MVELESFLQKTVKNTFNTCEECMDYLRKDYRQAHHVKEYRINIKGENIEVDNKNRRYIRLVLDRADMVSDFECSVPFEMIGGEISYPTQRFLMLCMVYHTPAVHMFLEEGIEEGEIVFRTKMTHFSCALRRDIVDAMNPETIKDGELIYRYGMVGDWEEVQKWKFKSEKSGISEF